MRGAPTKQHGPKTGLYLEVSFNFVCVCTCMCTCVCIYMCLWVSVSMYVHVFICICVYTYACACICGSVRVCKHMQLYVGVYMCRVRVYVCACVSGYVCMHVVCAYACVCGCDGCSYSCVCGCVHKGGVHVYMYTCVYVHVYACACVHTCRNQRRTLSPSIALHLIFESGSLIGRWVPRICLSHPPSTGGRDMNSQPHPDFISHFNVHNYFLWNKQSRNINRSKNVLLNFTYQSKS